MIKIRFTGVGLIIGSIFGMGAWMGLGHSLGIIPVIGTLFFYACMSYAFSGINVGPRVSLLAAVLGAIFGFGIFLAFKDLGVSLYIFSCMTTAFSFLSKK